VREAPLVIKICGVILQDIDSLGGVLLEEDRSGSRLPPPVLRSAVLRPGNRGPQNQFMTTRNVFRMPVINLVEGLRAECTRRTADLAVEDMAEVCGGIEANPRGYLGDSVVRRSQ
jgi:hypothetical protein